MRTRLTWAQLAAVAVLAACGGAETTADGTGIDREIDPRATCPECRIVLHHVASIGRLEDAASIGPASRLAIDHRGRYLLGPTFTMGEVAVYSPSGDLIGSIGRSGRGPGELGTPRYVAATRGDSVVVMDRTALNMFTAGGTFVRGRLLPSGVQSFSFLLLDDGRVLVNNYRPTRPAFGLLDETFAEVRFFGRTIQSMDWDSLQYQLTRGADGNLIAAQVNYGYVLEVWDTTGTLVRRYRRNVEWFPPWTMEPVDESRPSAPRPYQPRITGLHTDGQGRLWVCVTVADPRASEAAEEDYDRRLDTVIEILEMPSGRLYMSQRLDIAVGEPLDNGFLYDREEDRETGLLRFRVWRPEVVSQ